MKALNLGIFVVFQGRLNRKPQKQFNGVFNIRPGVELHMAAARKAMEMGVSLNAYIKSLIAKDTHFSAH